MAEEEEEVLAKLQARGRRTAVSDKSYNPDDARNRKKVVVEKSEEARAMLDTILKGSFLFKDLTSSSRHELIDAMFVKDYEAGDVIITQGEQGDFFYVIESGECVITVEGKGQVMECKAGDSFGELALMYNSPRAATVMASTNVRCWAVDRDVFKSTLLSHTIKKRDMYEAFLREVPLLASLSEYERMTVADALTPEQYNEGQSIITQGQTGDRFYIVERGTLDIIKDGHHMGTLGSGAYFGELALLNDAPRAATIEAATDNVTVLALDRRTFNNGLMKSTHYLLLKNAENYAAAAPDSSQSFVVRNDDGDSDED